MSTDHALPPELTIYTVGELLPRLKDSLPADAKDLRILASAVAEIDAAGVQLLLSLARTMQSRGGRLELVDASPGLCAAIEALGVADLLDSTPAGAAHAQ